MKRAAATSKKLVTAKSKLPKTRTSSVDFARDSRSDSKRGKARTHAKSGGASATGKLKATLPDPHVMEYAEVLAHAVEIFGSRIRANAWLNRPSRIFNNQSPLQVLTEDPAAVEEELVRIDEGMFF